MACNVEATWKRAVVLALFCYFRHVSVAPALEWVQQDRLHANDGAGGEHFGRSVSISGGTAIVGANSDSDNGTDSGSAYVYERSGSGWTQVAKLLPDDGGEEDFFGWSVSISGDTAIVGTWLDDDFDVDSGYAYIFQKTDSGWAQSAKLVAQDGAGGKHGYFGKSVSISGDLAIVGAYYDDQQGRDSGSAYVFQQSDSGWTQVAKLLAEDAGPDDYFGLSVAISGDTALVTSSTSAYIFEDSGSGWAQVAKLLPDDAEAVLGSSAAISDTTAIVGARRDGDNGPSSGAAYIFHQSDSEWTQVAKLLASDGAQGHEFGGSVAISDGLAIVGAERKGPNLSGSAYIFRESQGQWIEEARLLATDGAEFDQFGGSVSISNGTALVGAIGQDSLVPNAGAAYVFVVPEPSSVALLLAAGAGLLIFTLCRRRRGVQAARSKA